MDYNKEFRDEIREQLRELRGDMKEVRKEIQTLSEITGTLKVKWGMVVSVIGFVVTIATNLAHKFWEK